MIEFITQFHFLRPLWLLALIPTAGLLYGLWRTHGRSTGLESCIDANLLQHLTLNTSAKPSNLPFISLAIIWLLIIVALAGPTWKKKPQPLFESEMATIILLDLSPSMQANDMKPSRIVRAHLKIQDLLSDYKDGLTALIVYAGEAHVVTPLTNDIRTITNLLPTLKPGLLPIPGSNIEMAIQLATELLDESGLPKASLLAITDDIDPRAAREIPPLLTKRLNLTILGVGTDQGAPIPYDGDFLKNTLGETIFAKRNSDVMQTLAQKVGGYYLPVQADGSDITFFKQHLKNQYEQNQESQPQEIRGDRWHEFGPTMLLILVPLVALAFRRGVLLNYAGLALVVSLTTLTPNPAHASWWDSLWKNKDQQGLEAWQAEDYASSAEAFKHPQWKSSALYKQGDYNKALEGFSEGEDAVSHYNRGNTLAQLQRYDEAITAYEEALALKPDFTEAADNKALLEQLQQQEQSGQQSGDGEQSNNSQNSDQSSDQNSNNNSGASNEQNNQEQSDRQDSSEPSTPDEKDSQLGDRPQPSEQEADKNQQLGTDSQLSDHGLSAEEQQALQQWLRKVPDDPSGLLKRKFEYEFNKRRELYQQGKWQLPDNDAHERY